MKFRFQHITFLFVLMLSLNLGAEAQLPRSMPRLPRGGGGGGGGGSRGGGGGGDTLQRRDRNADSITITFRYLDSTRNYKFDSSLNDFSVRFPAPPTYINLGNTGTAARDLLFAPPNTTGWDPGFHAFDSYKWKLERVRFFNTTRPYTELGYVLGGGQQQLIDLIHTQNLKPYWNVALQYRMINSPGYVQNQKTNHNNYLVSSWYQAPEKRYNNFVVILTNKLQAGENGGLKDPTLLDDPLYKKRFNIATNLGGDQRTGGNFFSNPLNTGNRYKENTFLLRQQYDLGQKDSIVTDSTVIPLFYPRLRFEHTLKRSSYQYQFVDKVPDSLYYDSLYQVKIHRHDTLGFIDDWKELSNDFSIYTFPDAKNLLQYLKLGLEYQMLKGEFDSGQVSKSFYNLIAHGEYKNRSRNQKWDILAFGRLHLNGLNSGDYHAYISLQRLLSKSIGSLQVGFENVNRSPYFTYTPLSSFHLDKSSQSFSKENTLHFFAVSRVPKLRLQLTGDYYFVSNYQYLTQYYKLQQEGAIFNFLRIGANTQFRLSKRWNLYSDVWLQQKAGNADVNTPLFFTRQRLAFEGVFFKNLNLSTGLEVRYHSPYKPDNYSPVLGRYFYQDSVTINNIPEVSAFMHFRINTFKAFIRAENLNTAEMNEGFGFTNNNLSAPGYTYPGLLIRIGIYWSFVN